MSRKPLKNLLFFFRPPNCEISVPERVLCLSMTSQSLLRHHECTVTTLGLYWDWDCTGTVLGLGLYWDWDCTGTVLGVYWDCTAIAAMVQPPKVYTAIAAMAQPLKVYTAIAAMAQPSKVYTAIAINE